MNEKEIAFQRASEKERARKAWRDMTKLFILSSSIIFTTLFIVWIARQLPDIYMPASYRWNLLVAAISSLFIFQSAASIKKDELISAGQSLHAAIVLGLAFLVIHIIGSNELLQVNSAFRNILFPVVVIHILHVLIGIALLVRIGWQLKVYKVHSRETGFASNAFRYWHFLGVIWLLVVVFL